MKISNNEISILKDTINENLISLKKMKILEKKEITKTLNLIYENKDFTKKRDVNRFYIEFLIENERLLTKGYNQELISEQLTDLLFGYLGATTGQSILSYFKEFAAKWMLKTLGVNTDSFMGSMVITAFGNLKVGDIPNLFNCDFWVPFLAKTIVENFVRRWQEKQGKTDAMSSVLRNAIEKMITDTEFAKLLEKQLNSIICPLLPNLSDKLKNIVGRLAPTQTASNSSGSRESESSVVPST
jgi:hypothetical protein